jgi:hypothetical protein
VRNALPPPHEYLEGSRRAAANARQLCRAARYLERVGLCGPAATLLATAMEESAKAGVLVWLTEDDAGVAHARLVEKVFRDHKTKYRLAAWAIDSGSMVRERSPVHERTDDSGLGLIGLIAILLLGIVLLRREPQLGGQPPAPPDVDRDAEAWLDDLLTSEPDVPHPWVDKAFALRNAGLYVAYEAGGWHSPADLTAVDVREAREAVLPVVRGVSRWARLGSTDR